MKVIRCLVNALLVLVVILACALILPRLFGYAPYAVMSGSMEPEYPVGSVVYVQDVDPSTLSVGDDIAFTRHGSTVTHRIVAVDAQAQAFTTQGVANNSPDAEPVSFLDVIGKAVLCLPLLGFLSVYITSQAGRVIFVTIGALLVVASVALGRVGEKPAVAVASATTGRHLRD